MSLDFGYLYDESNGISSFMSCLYKACTLSLENSAMNIAFKLDGGEEFGSSYG